MADNNIDIELLTVEKVIVSRLVFAAHEIDNAPNSVMKRITDQLLNKMHTDGFVIKIHKIIGTRPLIVQKDTFAGQCYMDVAVLADVININTGDVLYNCVVTKISKEGIFAKKKDDMIAVLIPSDDLQDVDFSLFNKDDLINVEVVTSRATVYDNIIIVTGKLHNFITVAPRRLLKKISEPYYANDLTKEGEENYTTDSGKTLSVQTIPMMTKKSLNYEILGYPIGLFFQRMRIDNLDSDNIGRCDPYADIISKNNKLSKVKNKDNLGLWEILRVFHMAKENERVKIIDPAGTISDDYKTIVTHFSEKPTFVKEKENAGLVIATTENPIDFLNTIINALKYSGTNLVIKIKPVTTLFQLQLTQIVIESYKTVYMYKPMISNFLEPEYFIIATKLVSSDIVKALETFADKIKKGDSSELPTEILTNMSVPDFVDSYLLQFRVFNTMIYNIMAQKYIDILTINNRNMETIAPIIEKEKNSICDNWLRKMKIIE